jgi:hypothetical protein
MEKEHRNAGCVQHPAKATDDGDSESYRNHLRVASRMFTLLLRRNEEHHEEGTLLRTPASARLKLEIILH